MLKSSPGRSKVCVSRSHYYLYRASPVNFSYDKGMCGTNTLYATHEPLYTHFILTTLHRTSLISEKYRVRIEKYITGIVNNNNSHLYAIYANPEHIHFLVSRSPIFSEELLVSIIAESSQNFINQNKLCNTRFEWQESCSAFSVSKSDVDKVCKYILNQPEHHRKVSYKEEYETFIRFYQKTLCPLEKTRDKIIRL